MSELVSNLDSRAERIKELVGAVRINIIMIGLELIAAKEECAHGAWLPWLKENFGWTERTAQKYMAVAGVFGKNEPGSHLDGLTIDAKALYLLSGPAIPEEVKKQAVEKAEQGKTITLAEAEKMLADAVKKALAEKERIAAEEIDRQLAQAKGRHEAEVAKIEERFGDKLERANEKNQALAEELNRTEKEISKIKAAEREPTREDAIELFKKLTGKRQLSIRTLACIDLASGKPVSEALARQLAKELGPIVDKSGKIQSGRTKEQERIEMQRAQQWMTLPNALEMISTIELTPQEYFDSLPAKDSGRWFDATIKKQWMKAWPWLETFAVIWRKHGNH